MTTPPQSAPPAIPLSLPTRERGPIQSIQTIAGTAKYRIIGNNEELLAEVLLDRRCDTEWIEGWLRMFADRFAPITDRPTLGDAAQIHPSLTLVRP